MKYLLALCAFLSSVSFGASTGTLLLKGVVNPYFNVIINPETEATSLDITEGETNKLVAVVTEYSNNISGYKVRMSSANAGKLKNGTFDEVNYQVRYNGGSLVTPTASLTTVKTANSPALTGANSNVTVSFSGKSNALAGNYTDTLTFTIEAP